MAWIGPVLIFVFGGAAWFFGAGAIGHKSLVYKGVHFSSTASTLIYTALTVLSLGMVLMGVMLFFTALQGKRIVTLSQNAITVPRFSLQGIKYAEIPFSAITRLEHFQAGNGVFLNVHHSRGKSTLAKAAFQSDADFAAVQAVLRAKTGLV